MAVTAITARIRTGKNLLLFMTSPRALFYVFRLSFECVYTTKFDTSSKLKYLCIELGMARDCRHDAYGLVLPDILGKNPNTCRVGELTPIQPNSAHIRGVHNHLRAAHRSNRDR